VHEQIVDEFVGKLKGYVGELIVGDPVEPQTDIGTLVDEKAAGRIMTWIEEAVQEGAELIQGGVQTGANVAPTILLQPNRASKVVCQEVFGPIVSVIPIKSFEEGIAEANNSDFGLQVGVFTNNFQLIQQAIQQLEAGGVIINGTSNFRLDHLPYGGIKNSGIGREGPRFAIHEMTEMKMVVIRN
jgi:acyl-CoA reductase-like NAD-dependent aldehyde dehydrogenase